MQLYCLLPYKDRNQYSYRLLLGKPTSSDNPDQAGTVHAYQIKYDSPAEQHLRLLLYTYLIIAQVEPDC